MLLVGDRVVLRATTPPEAEYALFEIGDIELRSSEPGRVREHGYQTTVANARARLAQLGATPELARECAAAMQPVLSTAYARGPAVRHVARYLGAVELFQSDTFDGGSHTYHGVFVDLPLLVADLRLEGSGATLQALYLAMLLEAETDDTTVFLSTDTWTRSLKPGERTHRRPNLSAVKDVRTQLDELSRTGPRPDVREQLARADVIAFVRSLADAAPDEDTRALYASLERAISVRDMPDRGPLADPALWAIDSKLDAGIYDGALDAIEDIERVRGRTPGTTYLRARVSLALRLEPPKLIAERTSALALSMTSFQELCLLAAEAWLEAGDARRAMPYARDLVDAPGVEEGLLLRAQRLLARAVGAAPDKHKTYADSIPAAPLPPSADPEERPSMPPISAPEPHSPRTFPPGKSRVPTVRGTAEDFPEIMAALQPPPNLPPASVVPRSAAAAETIDEKTGPYIPPPSTLPRPVPPPSRRPARAPRAASVLPGPPPPPLDLELTPPPRERRGGHAPPSYAPPAPAPSNAPAAQRESASRPPAQPEATFSRPADAGGPASFTIDLPGPGPSGPAASAKASAPPPKPSSAPKPSSGPPREEPSERESRGSMRPSHPPRMGAVKLETRAPPSFDPRAEPDSSPNLSAFAERRDEEVSKRETLKKEVPEDTRRSSRPAPVDHHSRPTPVRHPSSLPPFRPPMATPLLDADLPPKSSEAVARTIEREKEIRRGVADASPAASMRGASLPPFRLESPPPLLPKAPLFPKIVAPADELAEHLSLPPGLAAERGAGGGLPKSVVEARVEFTHLARELGLDYRLKRGVELRADVSGIEAMQAVLLETFPDHTIRTADDAYELRRHGALLSEILARRLDAEWIDISPDELGYWAMIIPPDTRVWPFGRVARLIEMGHRERDLVSYFLELSSRARAR